MKTVYTENHILLVDETIDIKEGKPCYVDGGIGRKGIDTFNSSIRYSVQPLKIIASHPPIEGCLEFGTLPPNIENKPISIKEYVTDVFGINNNRLSIEDLVLSGNDIIETIEGYTQAKSETMFSLEELEHISKSFAAQQYQNDFQLNFRDWFNINKDKLTKPKEFEFVPEIDSTLVGLNLADKGQPKVINNKIYGSWKPRNSN